MRIKGMLKKSSSLAMLIFLLAIGGSPTALAQSGSSKTSRDRATAIKSRLPNNAEQDPMGQALTQALTDLDHCLNSTKIKDDEIKALRDETTALRKQLDAEEARINELRKANETRQDAEKLQEARNTAQEERFKLEEQRVALYKTVVDDFEKEVNRLRAKLLRAQFWGNVKFVLGIGLGAAITFGIMN